MQSPGRDRKGVLLLLPRDGEGFLVHSEPFSSPGCPVYLKAGWVAQDWRTSLVLRAGTLPIRTHPPLALPQHSWPLGVAGYPDRTDMSVSNTRWCFIEGAGDHSVRVCRVDAHLS